jgi:Fe2+ or Zn2+ uptake regulation protein
MQDEADRLTILRETIKKRGYRLTPARAAILATLVDSGGHVSADELVEKVNGEARCVSRMTVYRTLELLQELGLIRPVYLGTGAAHYILLDKGHHHHLVCSNCGRVFEFDTCVVAEISRVVGERFDFEIQGHLLEVYGMCPTCKG